ncbi:MAG: radical SAM protein [Acidobacteria bacterium]|nr:radical SAM protein [Acidobacteriota bacterium]
MNLPRIRRKLHALSFQLRQASVVAKAMKSQHHPIVAHIVTIRRCNLACTYCNEYDHSSKPVPLEAMLRRIDRLVELGTTVITISGGEPLLHPELDAIIRHIRTQGSIATLITNGYLLSPGRIERLNSAGLDHLQISIDNIQPDTVSMKSLKVLDKRLQWLAEHATFQVNINSVIGTSERPEDAATVARRARSLGFMTTVGIVHDGEGQLRALGSAEQRVYKEITQEAGRSFSSFAYYNQFQKNLLQGKPNKWNCRAGSRYLYVCEDGLVHYCSQQRGTPAIPLEKYTVWDLEREYLTEKSCAPWCTISCVHQVSMVDQFRENPHAALARLFPAALNDERSYAPPAIIRALIWMFLPPEESSTRKKITQGFARAAYWCLKVR